jgi:hypothetical protein
MGLGMTLYRQSDEITSLRKRLDNATEGLDWRAPEHTQACKEFHDSLDDDEKQLVDYYEGEGCYVITGNEEIHWRKFNALHNWMVQNIQDGVDECQISRPITKDELETLIKACEEDTLVPTSGFFFGSATKDEFYYEYLKETIEKLKALVDDVDFDDEDIVYTSSW